MKYPATILLQFICILSLKAQPLHIDRIPANPYFAEVGNGALLDKEWRWHTGDSSVWSNPAFNDDGWQTINPRLDVHDSLPQIKEASIFWLRIQFSIDSNIQRKQLALLVQQSGASDIYLNGELIKRYGIISSNGNNVRAYDPIFEPLLLPLNNKPTQLLAVRYALQKNVRYTTAFFNTNPLFLAKLQFAAEAIANYQQTNMMQNGYKFFAVGIFFLLALIHGGYYFFQKAQRANLFFALYAFCYLGYVLCPMLFDIHHVYTKYFSFTIALFLIVIVGPLLLTAIYELLNAKKDWLYKAAIILSAASIIVYFLIYDGGWHMGADMMSLLIQIAIIRIVFKAVRQKKNGAKLLAFGSIIFLVSFALFVLFGYLLPEHRLLIVSLFVVGVLSIPLTTSVYLGLEFRVLNLSLKQKLEEVSELSQKNITQAKEKEQMLADQNITLEKQVAERTKELNHSLENLRSAQSQLIQSEKMASLGELTAGIAHEIQNPLNFVNNFSEVSGELIDEMKTELDKGDVNEAKSIADDIKQNLEKINHHGKRADAIVKGMLQHSRSSSGQKEPTDINALCDEYLRLSYYGLRAKDKSFNATFNTDFDPSLPKINVVPQDIGRVLLNLLNNAFYVVDEKQKTAANDYIPTVSIQTTKFNDIVEISVEDNGNGIPLTIKEKIFQPFFTTKPTGLGTGLGLSLSYDIVKAHGGKLKVESSLGVGSKFIIQLIPTT